MPEQLELEAEEDEMEAAAAARARHDEMKEGERLKRYALVLGNTSTRITYTSAEMKEGERLKRYGLVVGNTSTSITYTSAEMKEGERLKRYYFYELQYVVFIGIQYRNMRCITSYQLLITHDHCCNPVLVLTHDHCYKSSVVLTHHLQAQGYRAP